MSLLTLTTLRRVAPNPWLMWLLVSGFTLFQFFLQSVTSLMVPELRESFHISAAGIAAISSSFYYIYVLVQVPAGMTLDVFGTRRVLAITALILSVGCFIFATARTLEVAIIGRIFMGLGSGFSFLGMLTTIKDWFPPVRFAVLVAISEFIGMMGTSIANISFAGVIQTTGWRQSMLITGIIAFIISILMLVFMHDAPNPYKHTVAVALKNLRIGFRKVITNTYLWLVGLYGGLMFSIATVYAGLWAIPYMMHTHYHLHLVSATSIATMAFVGLALGAPIVGWLSNRVACRLLMIVGAIGTLVLILVQIYMPYLSVASLFATTFLLGMTTSVYLLNCTYAKELSPLEAQGTGMGLANALVMSTSALLQPVMAYFMNLPHRGIAATQIKYSTADFQHGLLILPICFAISIIVAILLKEIRHSGTVLNDQS